MKILWKRCKTYDEAKNYSGIIYLPEWNNKPFYWGKAHNSFFGGNRRLRNGGNLCGRCNSGYKHWIEGCLRHGGLLYVGILSAENLPSINEIENFLIDSYPSEMNRKLPRFRPVLQLKHEGDVPVSIS